MSIGGGGGAMSIGGGGGGMSICAFAGAANRTDDTIARVAPSVAIRHRSTRPLELITPSSFFAHPRSATNTPDNRDTLLTYQE